MSRMRSVVATSVGCLQLRAGGNNECQSRAGSYTKMDSCATFLKLGDDVWCTIEVHVDRICIRSTRSTVIMHGVNQDGRLQDNCRPPR